MAASMKQKLFLQCDQMTIAICFVSQQNTAKLRFL